MSEQEMIIGKCTQCGEELRVPSRLERFSCMYCGQKLTQAEITASEVPVEGDAGQLLSDVNGRIVSCVVKFRDSREHINKTAFFTYFERMEAFVVPVLTDLDMACTIESRRRTAILEEVADTLLNGLEADWASGRRKKMTQDEDKMTLAIFLVPMIGKQKLSISNDFSRIIHEKWTERHPKNEFLIGDYDDIAEGFKKRFKLCFITTAVCESRGLPDDCAQLTAFRDFRDGYLMAQPEGKALVEEYYAIAPGIVTCIDHCADRTARYDAIGKEFLDPCYRMLQAGQLVDCQDTYTAMVNHLQSQYCS
ncbi:MAG: CFI-box-CTERM domain-containing protein [Eubacteriales bacterium]